MQPSIVNTYRLEPEERHAFMLQHHHDFNKIMVGEILPQLKQLIEDLHAACPSQQYQNALMDVESLSEHITSIEEDGSLPPYKEIPLEESEIQDEFEFPEDDTEIEFVQEEITPEYV